MARMKLNYRGRFGGIANPGDIVTDASGVSWIATRATSSQPGTDNIAWRQSVVTDPIYADQPPVKGEPGRNGRDGRDGIAGRDGRDGQGLNWRGEWKRRRQYQRNDVVEHEGSTFVAIEDTRSEPGTRDSGWSLMAARGERGEQGEQGYSGGRGRPGADGSTVVIENQSTMNLVAAENVSAGMVVRLANYDDEFFRASSLGWFPTINVFGLAATAATTGQSCKVAYERLTLDDWSGALESGDEKLAPGANYFVSKVLGKLRPGMPSTGEAICVGLAVTETTLLIDIDGIIQWTKPVVATLDGAGGVKGMFVSAAEGGHVQLALAVPPYPQYAAIGYLRNDCESGEEASVHINGGCLTLPDWSGVIEDGSSTLIEDEPYFISVTTPGKITNVEPTDNVLWIGKATSPTRLDITLAKASFSYSTPRNCS